MRWSGRPSTHASALRFGAGAPRRTLARTVAAFTLAELLVVIGIIAILAAIGLPALRGLGQSNAIDAATRQMLDDLAYARLRAINDRTTVFMLFVPPNAEQQVTNLAPYRLTGYTLYSRRSVGEQPGRSSPRQLIPWRRLPDGVFFAINKLADPAFSGVLTNKLQEPFAWTNNFYIAITNRVYALGMRYIAFDDRGRLTRFDALGRPLPTGEDQFIALVRGSVTHPQDGQGRYLELDAVEVPPGNRRYIRINWLTGRAEVHGDLLRDETTGQEYIALRPQ